MSIIYDNCIPDHFNTNNLVEYIPFYHDKETNNIIADEDWYNSLLDITKERIQKIVNKLEFKLLFTKMTFPHTHNIKNTHIELFKALYYAHIYETNYEVWCRDNNVKIIRIGKLDRNALQKMCMLVFTKVTYDHIEEELTYKFVTQIKNAVDEFNSNGITKLFVKLSGCSGKNYRGIYPCESVLDIVNYITNDKLYREYDLPYAEFFDVDVCVILMPWKEHIVQNQRYEFRLFMYNGKITGATQQHWYGNYEYTQEELTNIGNLLKNFVNTSIYKNAVIDAYMNLDTRQIELIEYGPFGAYSPSGSSLFRWDTDYDKLYNTQNIIYFRYRQK